MYLRSMTRLSECWDYLESMEATGIGLVLALPAWLLLVVAVPLFVLGMALNLIAWPITRDGHAVGFLLELAAVVIVAPAAACPAAAGGSRLIRRSWTTTSP